MSNNLKCTRAIKDDKGDLTIGKFIISHEIGSQTFLDTYIKTVKDMNNTERKLFKNIKPFFS